PKLAPRDLGCRGILHQVVDRNATHAPKPRLQVSESRPRIPSNPSGGDGAAGDFEQLGRTGHRPGSRSGNLVRGRHSPVEDLLGDTPESAVGSPGPVVTGGDFALLVGD